MSESEAKPEVTEAETLQALLAATKDAAVHGDSRAAVDFVSAYKLLGNVKS